MEVIQLLLASKASVPSTIEGKPLLEWASLRVRRRNVFSLLQKALALEADCHFIIGDAVNAANDGALAFATYVQQQPRGLTTHQMEQVLEESIDNSHVRAVFTLLRLGVDPSGPTLETPPLVTALCKNPGPVRQVLVEMLLDYKADLEPLDPRFIVKNCSVLDVFIASGADMPRRIQALHAAVWSVNLEAVAKLIRSGVNIDAPEPKTKASPLRMAAYYGFVDNVVYLLSRGANVNAPDKYERTPLQAALAGAFPDVIGNLLLDHGADASAAPPPGVGMTAFEALFCNYTGLTDDKMMALCDRLLAAGATVNRPDGEPSAVLHGIIGHGYYGLLPHFLGPPHNALLTHMCIWKQYRGQALGAQCTPTQLAAISGHLASVQLLVDHSADINEAAGHQCGRTALQGAAQCRPSRSKTELIAYLLDRGADVNAPPAPYRGITALQGAAISGDLILAEQRTSNLSCSYPFSVGRP